LRPYRPCMARGAACRRGCTCSHMQCPCHSSHMQPAACCTVLRPLARYCGMQALGRCRCRPTASASSRRRWKAPCTAGASSARTACIPPSVLWRCTLCKRQSVSRALPEKRNFPCLWIGFLTDAASTDMQDVATHAPALGRHAFAAIADADPPRDAACHHVAARTSTLLRVAGCLRRAPRRASSNVCGVPPARRSLSPQL
jgi:hypothetical protein